MSDRNNQNMSCYNIPHGKFTSCTQRFCTTHEFRIFFKAPLRILSFLLLMLKVCLKQLFYQILCISVGAGVSRPRTTIMRIPLKRASKQVMRLILTRILAVSFICIDVTSAQPSAQPVISSLPPTSAVNCPFNITNGLPLTACCGSAANVVLDSSVNFIGAAAFYKCPTVVTVNAPVVSSIGSNAFYNCSGLTSFDAPAVISIESGAFQGCSSLSSFTASPSITAANIGSNAFDGVFLNCSQVSPLYVGIGSCTSNSTSTSGSVTCPAGYFLNGSTQQCTLCPTGCYCPPDSSTSILCAALTYSAVTGASSCFSCPSALTIGSSTCTAYGSGPCTPGDYFAKSSQVCKPCPVGYYCPPDSVDPIPCAAGFQSNTTGQSSCALCDAGHYCPSAQPIDIWNQSLVTAPSLNWQAITSSADGIRLAAVASGGGGGVFVSTDSGGNWTLAQSAVLPLSANWASIASSSNGTQLVAVVNGGSIYSLSSSKGWVDCVADCVPAGRCASLSLSMKWQAVSSSADGTLLAAVEIDNGIYISSDSGASWAQSFYTPGTWKSITTSADGTCVVALIFGGGIYVSHMYGATGTWNFTTAPMRNWQAISSSSAGNRLAAVVLDGGIYISSDSGSSWIQTTAPLHRWWSIASSADGIILAAVGNDGAIYVSSTSGVAWTQVAPGQNWQGITASADGSLLATIVASGGIFIYSQPLSLGVIDVICPAGFYCPPGAAMPIQCPAGYFCPARTTDYQLYPCSGCAANSVSSIPTIAPSAVASSPSSSPSNSWRPSGPPLIALANTAKPSYSPVVTLTSAPSSPTSSAPRLLNATFGSSGSNILVRFDSLIDISFASVSGTTWSCMALLRFAGANSSTCSWMDGVTIQVLLPAGAQSPIPGDTMTIVDNKFRKACTVGTCGVVATSGAMNLVSIVAPANPVQPLISFIAPATSSICDDLIINLAITGSGGRSWSMAQWNVNTPLGYVGTGLLLNASLNVGFYAQPLIVPNVAFNGTVGVYSWNLSLTNFLGQSSSASFNVQIVNDAIPTVTIVGANSLTVTAADIVTIASLGTPSLCDPSTRLFYAWAVYRGDELLSGITSSSIDPTVFIISSYMLTPGSYTVQSTVTTKSGKFASANATVSVITGIVKAFISGGSSIQWASDQALTLDASGSVDENYKVSNLTFQWYCYLRETVNSLISCDNSVGSNHGLPTFTIPALTLSSNYTYIIEVVCTAPDGRYGTAAVTVDVTVNGAPIVVAQYTSSVFYVANVAKINVNDKLILNGIVFSNSTTDANWQVSNPGAPVGIDLISVTPTQTLLPAYGFTGVPFPLSLPGGVLSEGVTYTFRLIASVHARPELVSSGSLVLTVNAGPKSGYITASPGTGVALMDVFAFTSAGWTDDATDYPLQYDFSYQLVGQASILQLNFKSAKSSVKSTLPPGSSYFNYSINVLSTVYDNWGASTIAASAVAVTNFAPNTSITSVLTSLLVASGSDVASITSSCNVVASTFAQQNCANAPDCSSLNRFSCDSSTAPGQCGSCLSGFQGVGGSSNALCYSASDSAQTSTLNGSCSSDSQCLYFRCMGGICVVPSKSCPSASCSGHGTCLTRDASLNPVAACLESDAYCTATCACTGGYGGADCSISATDRANREDSRRLMCSSLLSSIAVQNPSPRLLDSLAASFSAVFSPYEFSSTKSAADCFALFGNISSLVQRGYLVGASTSTALSIARSISNILTFNRFVSSVLPASTQSLESVFSVQQSTSTVALPVSITGSVDSLGLSSLLSSLTTGLHQDMVPGQSDVSIVTDNFVLKVLYSSMEHFSGGMLAPHEGQGTGSSPQIQLPGSGLAACSGDSYLKVSIAVWSSHPYSNSSLLKTPLLRFSTDPVTGTIPSNPSNPSSTANTSFSITLPFQSVQIYNATSKLFANSTYPTCVERSGSSYVTCGCNATSFNSQRVVFTCASVQALCPSLAASGRRLLDSHEIIEYSSIYGLEGDAVAGVLSHPATPSLYASIIVGCLLFALLCGVLLSGYWDMKDRRRIKDVVDRVHYRRVNTEFDPLGSKFLLKDAKTTASIFATYDSLDPERRGSIDVIKRSGALSSPFSGGIEVVATRFIDSISSEHYAFNFVLGDASVKKSRTIRFVTLSLVSLMHLMTSTIVFSVLYPIDNGCVNYTSQNSCEAPGGYVEKLCEWSNSDGCSLRPPPESVSFIIALAILTALLSTPVEITIKYIMNEINSRRPNLESLGITTSLLLGEEVVSKTFDSEYLSELNDTSWEDREVCEVRSTLTSYVRGELGKNAYLALVLKRLGLVKNGRGNQCDLAVSWWDRLRGFQIDSLILKYIRDCKMDAFRLQKNLDSFDDVDDFDAKNTYLIARFIHENLSGIGQRIFENIFLKNSRVLQEPIDGTLWLFSWLFCIGAAIFMIYWVLQWGSLNGDAVVSAWGTNYATTFFYSLIVQELVILFLSNVVFIEYIRPKLQSFFVEVVTVHDESDVDHSANVVQILSPACRVGHFPVNSHLPAAHMLRCMSDSKLCTNSFEIGGSASRAAAYFIEAPLNMMEAIV